MTTERASPTATLLPSGKVLVAGGTNCGGCVLASAELYDPVAGTFSATGPMTTPRYAHTATLLLSMARPWSRADAVGAAPVRC